MKQYPLSTDIKEKAQVLSVAGEPTRMRILCLLYENKEACVNEIAEACDVSIAVASHHLQALKEVGLVACERVGQTMCYCAQNNPYATTLKKIICE